MNAKQRRMVLITIAILILMALFPPFRLIANDFLEQNCRYAFFANAPIEMNIDGKTYFAYQSIVNYRALFFQYVLIIVSAAVLYKFQSKR